MLCVATGIFQSPKTFFNYHMHVDNTICFLYTLALQHFFSVLTLRMFDGCCLCSVFNVRERQGAPYGHILEEQYRILAGWTRYHR